ncbi:MAG: hypothetical protein AAF413_00705 [Patescibacteria group bacterium]
MYSGWLLTNQSGEIFGAHQKINRIAWKRLNELDDSDTSRFPSVKLVQHFEGRNGPDGLKQKSPGQDEPHHFYYPDNPDATDLLQHLRDHYSGLVEALSKQDMDRAAYEAAWLSHVLTDGLTPAHHHPYEEEYEEIAGYKPSDRTKPSERMMIKGEGVYDTARKNWDFWGAKGLFMTHGLFELGFAGIIKPLRFKHAAPTEYDLKLLDHHGIEEVFKRYAEQVAELDMYTRFYERGWTTKLARDVREVLAPTIIKCVTLAWYSALKESKPQSQQK